MVRIWLRNGSEYRAGRGGAGGLEEGRVCYSAGEMPEGSGDGQDAHATGKVYSLVKERLPPNGNPHDAPCAGEGN
jgi:hypothetical protein